MKEHYLPRSVMRELVSAYQEKHQVSVAHVSRRVGLDEVQIMAVMSSKHKMIGFTLADHIVTKLVGAQYWYSPPLSEYYLPIDPNDYVSAEEQLEKVCPYCKETFYARRNKIYCSKTCTAKQRNSRRRTVLDKLKCAVCGNTFKGTSSTSKYCGKECRRLAKNDNVRKNYATKTRHRISEEA